MSLWLSGTVHFALGCFLAAMAIAMFRLFAGPTAQDRVMALDYMYVNGMLMVLAGGIIYASDAYFESALLMSMFGGALPVWADVLIGVLLIISGLLSFTGALGLVRIREFFTRLHPLALGSTLALWCVAAALVLCFSFTYQTLVLRAWLVVVFMAITVPVTVVLLARAALFRRRAAGEDGLPPTFAGPVRRVSSAPPVEDEGQGD